MEVNINTSVSDSVHLWTSAFIYGTSRAGASYVCGPYININSIYHFTFSLLFVIYHGITSPLNRKNLPLSFVVADVKTLRRPPTLSLAWSGAASPPMSGTVPVNDSLTRNDPGATDLSSPNRDTS